MAFAISKVRAPMARVGSTCAGLALALFTALAASLLGTMTRLPPVLFALMLGMALSSLTSDERLAAGLSFASREVLRFGVALLGAAITLDELSDLGWGHAAVTIMALAATLLAGTYVCRRFGQSASGSIVSAAAVAICGASAALAVLAALPKGAVKDQEVARIIAGITVAGSIAMLVFPYAGHLLRLSDAALGTFLGASIHEVAQAAASGFAVSEDVGKIATLSKMLRVACLGAIVAGVGILARRHHATGGLNTPLVPGFLLAFVALAALSSMGLIPSAARILAVEISRWSLLVAIAAIGMRTSFKSLLQGGLGPLAAIAVNSLLLTGLVLGGILFVRNASL